ncbi:hypothetical protein [Rhizobium nepotum]|uniref:Uncharacterized protein n=1 Tax=Rhizobium nepotum 39/7 TaxID=1368418 RepID=A0ABR5CL27_9HYPH|nr:hypothetical protein [Rhizobium nepotum]KJF65440.1 hypothetical protein RS75_23045 [Rhizobium nepotum 39/7]
MFQSNSEMTSVIHNDALIVDAISPLLQDKSYLDMFLAGRATCVAPTVAISETPDLAVRQVGSWLQFIASRSDLLLIRNASDI